MLDSSFSCKASSGFYSPLAGEVFFLPFLAGAFFFSAEVIIGSKVFDSSLFTGEAFLFDFAEVGFGGASLETGASGA